MTRSQSCGCLRESGLCRFRYNGGPLVFPDNNVAKRLPETPAATALPFALIQNIDLTPVPHRPIARAPVVFDVRQISSALPPTYPASACLTTLKGRLSESLKTASSIQVGSASSFLRKCSIASATGAGWRRKGTTRGKSYPSPEGRGRGRLASQWCRRAAARPGQGVAAASIGRPKAFRPGPSSTKREAGGDRAASRSSLDWWPESSADGVGRAKPTGSMSVRLPPRQD
jgi:hypothetical protein